MNIMVSEKSLSFRRRLSRLSVRCPDCQQVWLVPGLSVGDKYACKKCGAACIKVEPEISPKPRDLRCPLTPLGAVETPA